MAFLLKGDWYSNLPVTPKYLGRRRVSMIDCPHPVDTFDLLDGNIALAKRL